MVTNLFEKGRLYSRREIAEILGGGSERDYLITQEGVVVAGCFRLDLNPKAPEEIYPGFGPIIEKNAEIASYQDEPFPVFLKRGNKEYEYVGEYRSVELVQDPTAIEVAEKLSGREVTEPISGVLRLEPA